METITKRQNAALTDFTFTVAVALFRQYFVRIALLVMVIAVITALVVYRIPSVYRSTATLLIEADTQNNVGLDAVFATGVLTADYFETQRELIKSRSLVEQIVSKQNLLAQQEYQRPTVDGWWQGNPLRHLPFINYPEETSDETLRRDFEYAVRTLTESLAVDAVPRTRLMRIHVDGESAQLAQQLATAVANAYIERGLEMRLLRSQRANEWLSARLEVLKQSLSASEGALQAFLVANGMVDVGGVRSLVENDITENTANVLSARQTMARLQAVVDKISQARGQPEQLIRIPAIVANELVQDTQAHFQQERANLGTVAKRYGPKHPKRIAAESAFREATISNNNQIVAIARSIQSEYDLAAQSVTDLSAFADENKEDLQALDQTSYQLGILQRDVDLNRQTYDQFLAKLKETNSDDGFDTVNAVITDPAVVPIEPYSPQRSLIVVLVAMVAAAALYGLSILRWVLDRQIHSPDQLKALLPELATLGAIPKIPALVQKASGKSFFAQCVSESQFTEAIQSIRTGLLLSEPDKKNKLLMISSTVPGEGKSTFSMAVAQSFSRLEKVLLIEADLRKPRLGTACGLADNALGITQLMTDDCAFSDVAHAVDGGGFDLIPAGGMPPNPLELLSSQRFQSLLDWAAENYDRVIIDTPPIAAVSDALSVGAKVDGSILIVKADSTRMEEALDSADVLSATSIKVLGTVLNQIDVKGLSALYGDRYGYSGYYS